MSKVKKDSVHSFKGSVPSFVKQGKATEEELNFSDWMGNEESLHALQISVKHYKGATNNSIYIKVSPELAKVLDISVEDRVMVTFNKDHSMFGIRKDSRGLKIKGSPDSLAIQHANKHYNEFEADVTQWYAEIEDVIPMTTTGMFACTITQDTTLIEQRAADDAWSNFKGSTRASVKAVKLNEF